MTELHPITPSPELIEEWIELSRSSPVLHPNPNVLATYAARWGSDRELQLCLEWFQEFYKGETWVDKDLRAFMAARRPKPPSLKEQAKFAAAVLRSPDETCSIAELQQHWHTICNALEQLDD